jgi:hypothetical protein
MRAHEFIKESMGATTSGSVAVAEQPLGTTIARLPNIDKYFNGSKNKWMNSRKPNNARRQS